jgi:hypothetical protein
MKHTTYSLDIAKNVFEIAVSYEPGIVRESHRVARAKLLEFFAKREKGSVVMEACSSSHFWGARSGEVGPSCCASAAACRSALRSAGQDRPRRCQGNPRGLSKPGNSAGAGENRCPTHVTALHRMRSMWLEARTSGSTP